MSPVVPLSPVSITTQPQVQVVGDANQPKLDGIQFQFIREYLSAETHQGVFDLSASQAAAMGKAERRQKFGRRIGGVIFREVLDQRRFR